MKKLLIITAFIAVTSGANAQISFGVQAGANIGKVQAKYTGSQTFTSNFKSKTGLLIGAIAEIPFSGNILFRPELNFIQKGFKNEESQIDPYSQYSSYTYSETMTMNFIELPLNFVYEMKTGPKGLFFGAGPSFGFGISGKYKTVEHQFQSGYFDTTYSTIADVKFDGKKDANDNNAHLRGFEFGANLLAGYKMPIGLYFSLSYSFGLTNLSVQNNASMKTSGIGLKAGWMFGSKASHSGRSKESKKRK